METKTKTKQPETSNKKSYVRPSIEIIKMDKDESLCTASIPKDNNNPGTGGGNAKEHVFDNDWDDNR